LALLSHTKLGRLKLSKRFSTIFYYVSWNQEALSFPMMHNAYNC